MKNKVCHVADNIIIVFHVSNSSTCCNNSLPLDLLVMLHHRLADSMNLLLVLSLFGVVQAGRLVTEESSSLNFCIADKIHFWHI
jgi:hypothetical protein